MEQQVALGAVDVQRLGAVLASARLLPPLDGRQIPRRRTPGGAFGLRADAVREPHRVWDDGVAAVQQVPQGGAGGRGVERSVAGDGGGRRGRAEVRQRDASTGALEPLGQVCWFGWANWPVSPLWGPASTWRRQGREDEEELQRDNSLNRQGDLIERRFFVKVGQGDAEDHATVWRPIFLIFSVMCKNFGS